MTRNEVTGVTTALTAGLMFGLCCIAQEPAAPAPPTKAAPAGLVVKDVQRGEQPGDPEAALDRPLSVTFDKTPLETALNALRDAMGVNMAVNWTVLLNAGIERDIPVTLQLTGVPARVILHEILVKQASASNEFDPLNFSPWEGVLYISTTREMKRAHRAVRVYRIDDLVEQHMAGVYADLDRAAALLSPGQSGAEVGQMHQLEPAGEGPTVLVLGKPNKPDKSPVVICAWGAPPSRGELIDFANYLREHRENIVDDVKGIIIKTAGKQEDWADFGGDVASINTPFVGTLLINAPISTHREIESLLEKLRENKRP